MASGKKRNAIAKVRLKTIFGLQSVFSSFYKFHLQIKNSNSLKLYRNWFPCRRLNSTGEEDEIEEVDSDFGVEECPSSTSSSNSSISSTPASSLPANFNFKEHYNYLAARERLQEFPGQVPQKKKKVMSEEKAEAVAVKTQKKPKSKVSLIYFRRTNFNWMLDATLKNILLENVNRQLENNCVLSTCARPKWMLNLKNKSCNCVSEIMCACANMCIGKIYVSIVYCSLYSFFL